MKKTAYILAFPLIVTLFVTCEEFKMQPVTKVETEDVTSSATTILVIGNVIELSGENNNDYGFCYATHGHPSTGDGKLSVGDPEIGVFSATIRELIPNSQYYVRAYCQSTESIVYGQTLSIITQDGHKTLTTTEAFDITIKSAVCGGVIADDGGDPITARGVVWSTKEKPTLEDNDGKTEDGKKKGSFEGFLTNLNRNTNYFVRAYAANSIGVAYGNQINFRTKDGIIVINNTKISDITKTSAKCTGNVLTNGGDIITQSGVVWNTAGDPTIDNNTGKFSTEDLGEDINCSINNLEINTTYYARLYARNSIGTAYGEQISFSTLSDIQTYTLDDYLGEYTIHCTYTSEEVAWTPVVISALEDDGDGINVYVEGLLQGYSWHVAYGRWDEKEQCIMLQGGWYNPKNKFYFTSVPDVKYYSVFYPVFTEEGDDFYYLGGGDNDVGEAKLVMNKDGTISYQGSDPDDENRISNGFAYRYYLAETDEYKGYFNSCSNITLVPSSSSSKIKAAAIPISGFKNGAALKKVKSNRPEASEKRIIENGMQQIRNTKSAN